MSQQGADLSCASPLTRSGSGEGACVRWVALIDYSMLDCVVALEGDDGKDQLESLTMCVEMSNDIP